MDLIFSYNIFYRRKELDLKLNQQKKIGFLFVTGVIFILIPYTILTIIFEYPKILRQPVADILVKFNSLGSTLILTWWLFAISGIILLIAYNLLGSKLKDKIWYADLLIHLGTISGILQIIGLIRWTFIIPILAKSYVSTDSQYSKEIIEQVFFVIHQFGGVILGEHLGQIFTIIWTLLTAYALYHLRIISRFSKYFAYTASFIYTLAQLELFKTIFPDLISVKFSGLIGSTMWLVWLTWLGCLFIKSKKVIL